MNARNKIKEIKDNEATNRRNDIISSSLTHIIGTIIVSILKAKQLDLRKPYNAT